MVIPQGLAHKAAVKLSVTAAVSKDFTGAGGSPSKLSHVTLGRRLQFLITWVLPWDCLQHGHGYLQQVIQGRERECKRGWKRECALKMEEIVVLQPHLGSDIPSLLPFSIC